MPLAEGKMLGPYRIEAPMGYGGMATIYRATQPRLGRAVAIKMLHPAFVQDSAFLARFEREAQIVAQLDHPHIVPVYDFSDYEGQPYLVMKYIDGTTLKQRLESGPVEADEALRILTPIAAALDYAHHQGVLHRDIKPSNILLSAEGTPYLTDFGLARMASLGSSTLSSDVLLGTPHYISPEQAVGGEHLTPATDVYALGVVLYELATGRVPYTGDTPYAIVHAHIYDPLPAPRSLNPALPEAVEAVLNKALAKDPSKRYASATALIEAYRAAVESAAPAQAEPPAVTAAPLPIADPFEGLLGDEARLPHKPVAAIDEQETMLEKPKRTVVEASFDLSTVGESLRRAGESIKETFEDMSDGGSETDDDLAPPGDETALRRRVERQIKKRGDLWKNALAFAIVIPIMWVIYGFASGVLGSIPDMPTGIAQFPWPLIVMLGWAAGLASDAIETWFKTGKRAARRLARLHDEFRAEYGPQWYRDASRRELKAVRRRVDKTFKQRVDFWKNLASFGFVIPMLWIIFGFSSGFLASLPDADIPQGIVGFPWPLIVMLIWGFDIAKNGYELMGARRQEKAVEREIERQRGLVERDDWGDDKPKNDFRDDLEPRLTEDGELTDSMARAIERDLQRRR
jgi:serine/threonine protein kinase